MGKIAFHRVVHDVRRKQRKCLCCSKMFESEWIGNRMCETCKNTSRTQIETAESNRERMR